MLGQVTARDLIISHPSQLSLVISPWVGIMITSEKKQVVVSHHKLVSGCGLQKWTSVPPYEPIRVRKNFTPFVVDDRQFTNKGQNNNKHKILRQIHNITANLLG